MHNILPCRHTSQQSRYWYMARFAPMLFQRGAEQFNLMQIKSDALVWFMLKDNVCVAFELFWIKYKSITPPITASALSCRLGGIQQIQMRCLHYIPSLLQVHTNLKGNYFPFNTPPPEYKWKKQLIATIYHANHSVSGSAFSQLPHLIPKTNEQFHTGRDICLNDTLMDAC